MSDSRSDAADREPPDSELTTEELRAQVEEKYDFDDFGPREMAEMTVEEWEAAFDPDTWITGEELLDRVEADLKRRVIDRDVFARVERLSEPDRVVAYSDEGYAVVYPDGTLEGEGTVLRDVKPTVALCSMDEYDPPEMPSGDLLPEPMDVPEGSGEFGNLMIQVVAGAQVLAGLALLVGSFLVGSVVTGVAGLGFLAIGVFLLFTVANTRLSDRFRAEEYRNRLRAVGLEDGERPDFLPESAREGGDATPPDDDGDATPPDDDGDATA
ncbi:DUF7319 domain-containing protein [Halorarius halobius]|uniref:DUF7319 domain-containing protein n=1 Tax=Halorarius halobius TaxID=2962671 RepID=UPI0020CF8E0E|nr:hypothetical protein [Halorarius halobius]